MKIRLQLRRNQDAESYIRAAFAHITDKIVIRRVETTQAMQNDCCEAVVQYDAQPGTSGVDFNSIIQDAVSLRGDLTLLDLELPAKTIQVEGLRLVEENSDGVIYQVNLEFACYLARTPGAQHTIATQNVLSVSLEYECIPGLQHQYRYTGTVGIKTQGQVVGITQNAYNRFAKIVQGHEALRTNILDPHCTGLKFIVGNDGTSNISIMTSAPDIDSKVSAQAK